MWKKKNKIVTSLIAGVLLMALLTGMIWRSDIRASAESSTDSSTINMWQTTTGSDTKNIGRIWTDKTVSTEDVTLQGVSSKIEKGNSDFLISLSALSSAGKLIGATTSAKPLDIVMVLDTSGSMGERMNTYIYTAVYSTSNSGSYYGLNKGAYEKIDRVENHWEFNGQRVEPKTSANDNAEGHIQFYRRRNSSSGITKMQALKDAANAFVDSTAEVNKKIDDENKQHRISLVTVVQQINYNIILHFIY